MVQAVVAAAVVVVAVLQVLASTSVQQVLAQAVLEYLPSPPVQLAMQVAQAVLQVSPAHISHGGDGAYYVYLRRHR